MRRAGGVLLILALAGCDRRPADAPRPAARILLAPPEPASPLATGAGRRLALQLDAIETPTGTRVSVPGDVAFDKAAATIRPDTTERLDRLAALIVARRPPWVAIEGHSDGRGGDAYNKRLSLHRARAVRDYLVRVGGIDRTRVRLAGLGAARAVATNRTEAGRARNRRVEVILGR